MSLRMTPRNFLYCGARKVAGQRQTQ